MLPILILFFLIVTSIVLAQTYEGRWNIVVNEVVLRKAATVVIGIGVIALFVGNALVLNALSQKVDRLPTRSELVIVTPTVASQSAIVSPISITKKATNSATK